MLKANPIMEHDWGSVSFISHECDETLTFIVPVSRVNELVAIAQTNDVWKPSKFDYIKQTILQNGQHKKWIYRHIDCYGLKPVLKFYANQVTFNNADFQDFEEEHWTFEKVGVLTPHGNIMFDDLMFVDNGQMIGIQFATHGLFKFNELEVDNNSAGAANVKTLAIMRQPYNAWLWIYMFDSNDNPIASFCGHDDLDGFAKYINRLKSEFS